MSLVTLAGNIHIVVYYNDVRKHKRPHFHAVGPDRASIFGIPDFDQIVGDLRGREVKVVLEWAEANRNLLRDVWNQRNPGFPVREQKEGD